MKKHQAAILRLLERRREFFASRPGFVPVEPKTEFNGAALQIIIDGYIGDDWLGVSALSIVQILNDNPNATTIDVRIVNSPGGDAFDGVAMLNALADHPAEVTVTVVGQAASAATLPLMAGQTVRMGAGSRLMIHRASTFTWGNESDHDDTAEILRDLDGQIKELYAGHTGQEIDQITDWMAGEGTFFNADQAVEAGFADEKITLARSTDPEASFARFENLRIAAADFSFGARPAMTKNANNPKPADDPKPAEKSQAPAAEPAASADSTDPPRDASPATAPAAQAADTTPAAAAPPTVAELREACPGASDSFLLERVAAGDSIDQAKAIHGAVQTATADLAKENDQLRAKADLADEADDPVSGAAADAGNGRRGHSSLAHLIRMPGQAAA